MQPLKILVIAMGVLILAGVVVVAVTVANRLTKPRQDTGTAGAAPRGFDSAALPIPHGCRIEALQAAGERLILRLAGGDACEQILIVDLGTGKPLGRLDLVEAP